MPTPPTLRPYRPEDAPALAQLFRETIHTVNRRDYTPAQVEAWAPAQIDLARWQAKLASEEVVVAEVGGELAGFCSWTADGYLNFIFVHHAQQRKGIAAALYTAAEQALRAQGLARIHTQASVTAQPFFARQGFTVVKHQLVHVRGVDLPNAVMEKSLA
ncbi:MAG: GNAT family N-acetyltransferase [Opitutae bacterium]|nr:GNAT family N-acetyltransferase [Opitutae bacterium]